MVIDCILTTLLHSYSLCVCLYTYMYDTRWMYLTLILLAAVMRVAGSDYEDIVLSWILFMAWMYTLSYGRGFRFMGPYLVMIKEVLVQRLSICLSVCHLPLCCSISFTYIRLCVIQCERVCFNGGGRGVCTCDSILFVCLARWDIINNRNPRANVH